MTMTAEYVDGYDRRKAKTRHRVTFLTLDQVKGLQAGQRVSFVANDGTIRSLTINGQVKRWKRDPDRVEVPVKYGMYECARLNGMEAIHRLCTIDETIEPV